MFVMVVITAVIAPVLALLLIAVVVGARHEHPTDLATQGLTVLAAFVRQVLGLYVRRASPRRTRARLSTLTSRESCPRSMHGRAR